MIITRILGGLGNQMFQYAIARSLAIKNNDVFKLDISFYPKQTLRKYELNKFNIIENIATDEESNRLRGNEGLIFKIKNKLCIKINRPKSYYKEKEIVKFDENIFKLNGDIYLDGYWQNGNYFKDIRDVILKDFTLKERLSDKALFYLDEIKNSNSVSIHIRRGDYLKGNNINIHGVCDLTYYKKAINYILKYIASPTFFIFSDDMSWCKENFNFLNNVVFIDNSKNALEDLELMKNCKHNIIANSTFSWWGAWLNENEDKIIIGPKQWFMKKEWKNLNLICEEWIKV